MKDVDYTDFANGKTRFEKVYENFNTD